MSPKFEGMSMVMLEQGEIAEAAFNAVNGMIDSMANTTVFSHCRLVSWGGMAEQQRHIGHNFVDLRERDLRRINGRFISPRRVSRHLGTDITLSNCLNGNASIEFNVGRKMFPCQLFIRSYPKIF
jgi:hypothetical protein